MIETHCPNCGAPIRFGSNDLPVKVCDYCHSSVLRTGDNVQAIGKVAEVPDDVSPLQLGVRGRDGDHGFELVGRVRWRYEDGAWNEWLALFDDGSIGWVGESMGRYMMLRQVAENAVAPVVVDHVKSGLPIAVGTPISINGVDYAATDAKQVTCVASEGELPFHAPLGLSATSVDLMTPDGACASIQKGQDGEVEIYTGRYLSLAELKATGLRSFEGWPMPAFAA
ncbi:MAG TPA: DUF4178 domain-containing protein [Sphingomonas sp.]